MEKSKGITGMKLRQAFLTGSAAGLLWLGLSGSPALAAPISLTWNPSASVPALSTAGPVTFTNALVNDYAAIFLTPAGGTNVTASENGFLQIAGLQNPGPQPNPGLNGQAGADPYGLYLSFTATASASCPSAGNCSGAFTGLTFSLMGDVAGNTTFGFAANGLATSGNTGDDILLATGALASCGAPSPECQNGVTIANGVPSAAVTTSFNPAAGQSLFFAAPSLSLLLSMQGSFVNNTSEVTCFGVSAAACGTAATYGGALPAGSPAGSVLLYQLGNPVPGGGTLTFSSVPEPGTLALVGTGLLGLAGLRRRRSRK